MHDSRDKRGNEDKREKKPAKVERPACRMPKGRGRGAKPRKPESPSHPPGDASPAQPAAPRTIAGKSSKQEQEPGTPPPPGQEDSLDLVRRAKGGDRSAWDILLQRYYPQWEQRLRGKLSRRCRSLFETQDILQSALREALARIHDLRSENAFFAWINVIAERKLLEKERRRRREPVRPAEDSPVPVENVPAKAKGSSDVTDEDCLRLLATIDRLLPEHQEAMTVVYLHYIEKVEVPGIAAFIGKSKRTIFRLLNEGKALLRKSLGARGEYTS